MKKSLFTAVLIGGAFAFFAAAVAVAQSASADQPAASPGAKDVRFPASPDALVQRQDTLLEQMAELDSSAPDFQSRLRELGAELQRIQEELQTIDRADTAQPAQGDPLAALSDPGTGSFPVSTAAQPDTPVPFSPFDGMDPATMRRTRADLLTQLKYLNRTLETLGPQDEALADSLTEQKLELTARIRQLDERIGSSAPETKFPAAEKAPAETVPPAAPDADPAAAEFDSAGTDRIDAVFGNTQVPAADPTDVDGAWYSGENKNQKILDAIAELQKSNDETNRRLDEVLDELKTIETQLKLLSRQAVLEK